MIGSFVFVVYLFKLWSIGSFYNCGNLQYSFCHYRKENFKEWP